MVKDLVLGRYGLGRTMDECLEWVVGDINIATTINNKIEIIIVVVFDET